MTHTPLDSFESALLTELRRHVAGQSVVPATVNRPARRGLRRLAVGAVAAGLAASVVGVVGIGGHGGPSPAYAVELDGDGDVVVTVHRLDDAGGLEKALRDKGIDADVSYDADGTNTVGIGPDGQPLGEDELPDLPPDAGSQQDGNQQDGTATGGLDEAGTGAQPAQPGVAAGDPCGFDAAAPPADLSRVGNDWVLRIPAGSPLMDRHVLIGTDADGGLSVFYSGDGVGSFCGVSQSNSRR